MPRKLAFGMMFFLAWCGGLPEVLPIVSAANSAQKKGGDGSAAQLRRDVNRWTEQLSSDELAVRARAESELLKLGPAALPLLQAPELARDVSAREALRRVRQQLELRQARESVKPSKVTLKGRFELENVLREIERQTGNRLTRKRLSKSARRRTIELDWNQASFWHVLDELCRDGKLQWQAQTTGGTSSAISFLDAQHKKGEATSPPIITVYGPFRMSLISVAVRPLVGNDTQRLLRMQVALHVEPRLRPLFLKYAEADVVATDGSGMVLPPFNPKAQYEIALGSGGSDLALRFDFLIPNDTTPARVGLTGTLSLTVAGGQERIEFLDVDRSEGVARRRGGVTVKLTKITRLADPEKRERRALRLATRVGYDAGGPAFESHRTWIFHNEAFLESPTGQRIEKSGAVNVSLHADGAVGVEFPFADLPKELKDWKFVYVAPTLILDVPIQLSFSKIDVARMLGK